MFMVLSDPTAVSINGVDVTAYIRRLGFDLTDWQIDVLQRVLTEAPATAAEQVGWVGMPRRSGRRHLREAIQTIVDETGRWIEQREQFTITTWWIRRAAGWPPCYVEVIGDAVVWRPW